MTAYTLVSAIITMSIYDDKEFMSIFALITLGFGITALVGWYEYIKAESVNNHYLNRGRK
jgi:hypothetical protein